jgi:hypothetical protein
VDFGASPKWMGRATGRLSSAGPGDAGRAGELHGCEEMGLAFEKREKVKLRFEDSPHWHRALYWSVRVGLGRRAGTMRQPHRVVNQRACVGSFAGSEPLARYGCSLRVGGCSGTGKPSSLLTMRDARCAARARGMRSRS